jgi:hypothetical protein
MSAMCRLPPIAAVLLLAAAAHANEKRQMGAHEHGHGTLDIAIEGNTVQMALVAPGADIVGFEHAAESDEQKAALAMAEAKLAKPLALFVLPPAAGCAVTAQRVEFEVEHDEHDHDKGKAQAEKDHKGGEEAAGHAEFHAEYTLTCASVGALGRIEFAYFSAFPAAEELEVQVITEKGQSGFEVTPEAPVLDLGGMI